MFSSDFQQDSLNTYWTEASYKHEKRSVFQAHLLYLYFVNSPRPHWVISSSFPGQGESIRAESLTESLQGKWFSQSRLDEPQYVMSVNMDKSNVRVHGTDRHSVGGLYRKVEKKKVCDREYYVKKGVKTPVKDDYYDDGSEVAEERHMFFDEDAQQVSLLF